MYQGMRRVGWGVRLFQGKFDFPVAQMVKRLPIMQETRVQSLGWEDPLEKEGGSLKNTLNILPLFESL